MARLFRIAILVLFLGLAAPAIAPADSLSELLAEYEVESQQLREQTSGREEMLSHWNQWLPRFTAALSLEPHSPHRRQATLKALGIANSSGNYDVAQELASAMLQLETRESMHWRWKAEAAEIAKKRYSVMKDPSARSEAIAYYNEAIELAEDYAWRDDPNTYALHYSIRNMAALAGLYRADDINIEEAANTARVARRRLADYDIPAVGMIENYGVERFASQEFALRIDLDQQPEAKQALAALCSVETPKRPVSSYFRGILRNKKAELSHTQYVTLIDRWYDLLPDDEEKPLVLYSKALSYTMSGNDEEAMPIYETLYKEHASTLLEFDAQKANEQLTRGESSYPFTMFCLIKGYKDRKQYDEALRLGRDYIEQFPASEFRSRVEAFIESIKLKSKGKEALARVETDNNNAVSLLILANIVFFGALVSIIIASRLARVKTQQ